MSVNASVGTCELTLAVSSERGRFSDMLDP